MPDHRSRMVCFMTVALCSFSPPAQATTFNVLGTETKDTMSLTFLISDATGIPLGSESWDSKTMKYQDEDTDKMLSLMFWDVAFQYDATKTSFSLTAFHKIDPHTGAIDAGDTFSWDALRPAATEKLGDTGAFVGTDNKQDSKDHTDSGGAHHDSYNGQAAYKTNFLADPMSPARVDQFAVELAGTHCGAAAPKSSLAAVATCAWLLPNPAASVCCAWDSPCSHVLRQR
jgi:hypothetical protein